MTDKQKSIAAQVIRLVKENARFRVALAEIAFRCQRQLDNQALNGWRIELAVTEIRDTAKKALEPEDGTLRIKKGS